MNYGKDPNFKMNKTLVDKSNKYILFEFIVVLARDGDSSLTLSWKGCFQKLVVS